MKQIKSKNTLKYTLFGIICVFSILCIVFQFVDLMRGAIICIAYKYDILEVMPLLYNCKLGIILRGVDATEDSTIIYMFFSALFSFFTTMHWLGFGYLGLLLINLFILFSCNDEELDKKTRKNIKIMIYSAFSYFGKFILCAAIFGICYNGSSKSIVIGCSIMGYFQIVLDLGVIALFGWLGYTNIRYIFPINKHAKDNIVDSM